MIKSEEEGRPKLRAPPPRRTFVKEEDATPGKSWCQKQGAGLAEIFLQPISLLLVFVPLGIVSGSRDWGAFWTFNLNFMAIIPLSAVMGASREMLAAHAGQTVGGLLKVTFGNAVEMIMTITAVRSNLVSIVQQVLIGSILSNLLLVLGTAFMSAGLVTKVQRFNATGAGTNISCLVLSSLALTLPTVFSYIPDTQREDEVRLSRTIACVMAFVYLAFLVFQLHTHDDLFAGSEGEAAGGTPRLSIWLALLVLAATLTAVACCAKFLVENLKEFSAANSVPQSFIGLILLPMVGNAAEHTTSVSAAYGGMTDLAVGVAVGSSTQIALFVVPFSVIAGYVCDVEMTLDFKAFDATILLLSVFIASGILGDGVANWFEGLMLVSTYGIVAVVAWYLPEGATVGRLLSELGPALGYNQATILV